MVDLKLLDTEKDLAQINSWAKERGMREFDPSTIPDFALIAPGLAAGFLYKTDSTIAIIEGLITNPSANKLERGRAIDDIIKTLLDHAKEAGFKYVKGDTRIENISARARSFGFHDLGFFSLFGKAL